MLPSTDQDYICQCHFCVCTNTVDTKEGICWQCKKGAHEDAFTDKSEFYVGERDDKNEIEW